MNAQENRGNLTVQRSDCISSGAKPHTFCLLVIPVLTQGYGLAASRKVLPGFQDVLVLLDAQVAARGDVHIDLGAKSVKKGFLLTAFWGLRK